MLSYITVLVHKELIVGFGLAKGLDTLHTLILGEICLQKFYSGTAANIDQCPRQLKLCVWVWGGILKRL